MKNFYKVCFLIFGLITHTVANAETCNNQYNTYPFDMVAFSNEDQRLTCYYQCPWPCVRADNYYSKIGYYTPIDGPWFGGKDEGGCRGSAEECRFKKMVLNK